MRLDILPRHLYTPRSLSLHMAPLRLKAPSLSFILGASHRALLFRLNYFLTQLFHLFSDSFGRLPPYLRHSLSHQHGSICPYGHLAQILSELTLILIDIRRFLWQKIVRLAFQALPLPQ